MVHGGGHHHGGIGGGSFGGGGRRGGNTLWATNTNVRDKQIVVFNHNHYHTSGWSSYQQSYIHHQNKSDADDCKCCEQCWRRCCIGCTDHAPVDTLQQRQQQQPQNCCRWWCHFLTVSFVLVYTFFFLMFSFPGGGEDWTLNAGETRQVVGANSWLTNHIAISTNVPDSVSLYAIDGTCPPLTGPTIQIANTETIQLAQGDYQYDYFYLNAGSLLDVSLQQDYGASNLMVMRGLGTVQGDANGESDNYGSFSSKALLTRYAGATQIAHVQYVAPKSDTYVVVYENASNSKGRSTVTYQVYLKTYEMNGITPISDCESSIECNLDLKGGRQCLLVRAMSEVTVHVSTSRRMDSIFFYSIVPLSLVACLVLCKRKQEYIENPPATAPMQQHSAYVIAEPLVSVPTASAYPMATAISESDIEVLLPSAPLQNKQ